LEYPRQYLPTVDPLPPHHATYFMDDFPGPT
jgi:hypothetical protein